MKSHDLDFKDNHTNIFPNIIHKFSAIMKTPSRLGNSDIHLKEKQTGIDTIF